MKKDHPLSLVYSSAQFRLGNPGIFFQFRIRQTDDEPLLAIIKKDSVAMTSLKSGQSLPVVFHFSDKTIPAQQHTTRIKYIKDGGSMGFKGHAVVALDIVGGCGKT